MRSRTAGAAADEPTARTKPVTLIKVFALEPAKHLKLIELLTRATEDSARQAPEFLHVS